jgi:hypothetical protein
MGADPTVAEATPISRQLLLSCNLVLAQPPLNVPLLGRAGASVALLQREPVELLVCQEVLPEAVLILAGLLGSVGLQGIGIAMCCLLILHGTVHLVEVTLGRFL